MPSLEENLAREMARMKMDKEKNSREIEKICAESPELRELQNKIKSAYLNRERATQVTEHQYRQQIEVVSTLHSLQKAITRQSSKILTLAILSGYRASNGYPPPML